MASASDSDRPGPAADEGAPSVPGGAGADVVVQLPDGFENDETAQLVKRAQNGDAEALNDLFTRFHSLMVEVARKRLGPKLRLKEDPDDLAQTTFREATRDFKNYEYRGEGSLLRWLVQILQNKIRDKAEFYSAGKRDTSLETTLDRSTKQEAGPVVEPMAEDLSVTRQVQRGERFHLLRDALEELSPEYRQAITLVFFQGLTLREAGQRLGGRSEDALRMILRRAEAKLRSKLGTSIGTEPEE